MVYCIEKMSKFSFCLILILSLKTVVGLHEITVGGLFHSGNDEQHKCFELAVQSVNNDKNLLKNTKLLARVEIITSNPTFQSTTKKACDLLRSGVASIFGPQLTQSTSIGDICEAFGIPYIENTWNVWQNRYDYAINLHPHPASLSKAYSEIIESLGWKKFVFLYENNNGLLRAEQLLQNKLFTVTFKKLTNFHDYRPLLQDIKESGTTHIVLDVETKNLPRILKQAQQVGLVTAYDKWFITSLDLHNLELEDFQYAGSKITGLQLIDSESYVAQEDLSDVNSVVKPRMRNNNEFVSSSAAFLLNKASSSKDQDYVPAFDLGISNLRNLTTESALTYDAVHLFARALDDLSRTMSISVKPLKCEGNITWDDGQYLINQMKQIKFNGLTGPIRFDDEGLRRDFRLDITELTQKGLTTVGSWELLNGVQYTESNNGIQKRNALSNQNLNLTVVAALAAPYVMMAANSENSTGNKRFEGFCVDLLDAIAKIAGFNYTIRLNEGGKIGKYNRRKNKWDGLMGELVNREADLAIGDFTVTKLRKNAVDFTLPWMNTGISILYLQDKVTYPGLFSFVSPFPVDIWIMFGVAYLAISVLLFVLAKFGQESTSSVPTSKQFSILNCLWFCFGPAIHSGNIQPKALSTRIAAGVWWIFNIILICTYTASLASFFSAPTIHVHRPIESVEDLAKQSDIKYGLVRDGATHFFFRDNSLATYKIMHHFMAATTPSVYVNNFVEGAERVSESDGRYAFLMEASSIEYLTERNCSFKQIGGLLNAINFAFALPAASPYTSAISEAILTLRLNGQLELFAKVWWKYRHGGGKCMSPSLDEPSGKDVYIGLTLGWNNLYGIFCILLAGMILATIVGVIEFVWKRTRSSKSRDLQTSDASENQNLQSGVQLQEQ